MAPFATTDFFLQLRAPARVTANYSVRLVRQSVAKSILSIPLLSAIHENTKFLRFTDMVRSGEGFNFHREFSI